MPDRRRGVQYPGRLGAGRGSPAERRRPWGRSFVRSRHPPAVPRLALARLPGATAALSTIDGVEYAAALGAPLGDEGDPRVRRDMEAESERPREPRYD